MEEVEEKRGRSSRLLADARVRERARKNMEEDSVE